MAYSIIKQGHVSQSLHRLRERFMSKYNLEEYKNNSEPLIIFGMYKGRDYEILNNHKGHLTVVWCGSDSLKVNRDAIKKKIHVRHIALSKQVSEDLIGIKHTILPISACSLDYHPCQRGDSIYFYGNSEIYGVSYLPEIKKRTGLNVIHAHGQYSQSEIRDIYRQCFIGLRLTRHDGLPNTVLELGMMGRRSIYNGNIPHSIKWKNIDDICESIMREYHNRNRDNSKIAEDIKKYLDIGYTCLIV